MKTLKSGMKMTNNTLEDLLGLNPENVKALTIPLESNSLYAIIALLPVLKDLAKDIEAGVVKIHSGNVHMCIDEKSNMEHISFELFFNKIEMH
jgi:hypothetical protein